MTPRERVLTALAHQPPERVPFSWGFCATPEMAESLTNDLARQGIDWPALREAVGDIVGVGPEYIGPLPANGNHFTGIWGIRVQNVGYGSGTYQEFTEFPLAGVEDAAVLAQYPWPSPDAYDYAKLRDRIQRANPQRRRASQYVAGNPFELYCWMTGLEEAMINAAANPTLVRAALDHITNFLEARARRTLQAAGELIDIVFLADDLGGQTGLLMSRDTYRELLQPFHRRLTDCVHNHAPHARCMFHTDGAVFDIIPDLLDAGIDILEAVQTDAVGMDPARLKSAYGDRLSFHGAISVQQLLPKSDAATVERECRRLVEVLGRNGGYIAAPAHAIQVGTPTPNVLAMLRGVLGEGEFENALRHATAQDRVDPRGRSE
jgi:uroporphyrinogen decarboxylase